MQSIFSSVLLSLLAAQLATAAPSDNGTYEVHDIVRIANLRFENLAVRANGQILTTTTTPNASIYQIDPLSILPPTLIYNLPNITSACGIAEREKDVFYVAYGSTSIYPSVKIVPGSYYVLEVDIRGVEVLPTGRLTRQPAIRVIANIEEAGILNGVAFARPESNNLLIADTILGLIWNVDICDGAIGITLNDTTTKGTPGASGQAASGINGLKVYNGTMYWSDTGSSKLYKVDIDERGHVVEGQQPALIASNVTCDDLVVDHEGDIYVGGPMEVITKVTPSGQAQIIAGTYNSTNSSLVYPTALKFGRMASDRWSLYVTTNGGLGAYVPDSFGISRIDLGEN